MNKTLTYNHPIGSPLVRVDKLLAEEFPEISRSQLKSLILDEAILRKGKAVKPSTKIHPGDEIILTVPEPEDAEILAEDIPLDIIYQDSDFAVINKPAGMVSHPAGTLISGTLVNAAMHAFTDLSGINGVLRPGIVHRLDKDTTGLIIIAKNDISHRNIAAQFEARDVKKRYIALAWGPFDKKEGTIDRAIERSKQDRRKMVCGSKGRESRTEYKVLKSFKYLTLIEAHPKTGRTHQIRTHFASIGHPVFGDEMYKGRSKRLLGLSKVSHNEAANMLKEFPRHALHAADISFKHPTTGKTVSFSSPLPADMQALLDHLEK